MDLRRLSKTVKKVVDSQGDKIAAGVGKATDIVDKKTKGKYADKLEKLDRMAEKLDTTKKRRPGDAAPEGPATP